MLNIANYVTQSKVNGPGTRFVIWFQGCENNCEGCYNQEFRRNDLFNYISVEHMYGLIRATGNIEGVTFSGGEPFLQAREVIKLAELIKESDLSLLVFTGYTLDTILNSEDFYKKELLKYIDILVDGEYIKELKCNQYLKGSSNQNIHILNDNCYLGDINKNGNEVEVIILKDGSIKITGFPEMNEDML